MRFLEFTLFNEGEDFREFPVQTIVYFEMTKT